MDKERIIDKIKKCLALTKSSNKHEAERALHQARTLMDQYQIEMGDVVASDVEETSVLTGSDGDPPSWRARLAIVCSLAFGCQLVTKQYAFDPPTFQFIGISPAQELSAYAYEVLERQLQRERRVYVSQQKKCKLSTRRARGDAFAHSWIDAVRAKIDQFAGAEENQAVAIEHYMRKHYPNIKSSDIKRRQVRARDNSAAQAGFRSGKAAQLHQAVSGRDQARLAHQCEKP